MRKQTLRLPNIAAEWRQDLATFRRHMARMPEAMVLIDRRGRYVDANQAACRLLRKSRREILRHGMGHFSGHVPRARLQRAWRQLLARGTLRGKWLLARPGGPTRTVEFVARANILPGFHLSCLHDISARQRVDAERLRLNRRLERLVAVRTRQLRQLNDRLRDDAARQREIAGALRLSERRLRAALEANLNAVYILAPVRNRRGRIVDFCFTDANARAVALVGGSRRHLLGGLLCELMPINRTAGFFDRFVGVMQSGEPLEETFQLDPPWARARWKGPKWIYHRVVRLGDGIMVSTRDVTAEKRAEDMLRALPHQLTQAQEAERQRVARELNDGVKQMLVSARLALLQSQGLAPAEESSRSRLVARAAETLRQTLEEVRRISSALRPVALDDLGLRAALSELLADFRDRTGIRVTWRKPPGLPPIPPATAMALYRIGQESLSNVARHAQATRVTMRLATRPQQVILDVTDDGRGFRFSHSTAPLGRGLLHMRERAEFAGGTIVVISRPGRGTKVEASLPLP